jgi:hypothetical protein
VPPKKSKDFDENAIMRKYYEQYDDETLESLKRYYNVSDSEQAKFLRYVKSNSLPPADS